MSYYTLECEPLEEKGLSREKVIIELEKAYEKDFHFGGGRILNSMCTLPHELARFAHSMFIESNLGNPGLYPGTQELEGEVVKMLSRLLNGRDVSGHIVGGGTEANITALWIAKKVTERKVVLIPRSAHFSFVKACNLLCLDYKCIDLDENYALIPEEVEKYLSENTAAVIGVAGTTELGVIDPIEKLSEMCSEKTYLHVDAAFGGFVIPFMKDLGYDMPKFDFELDGVSSITIDSHKMGLSTIPSGTLLTRESKFFENISVDTPYLTCLRQTSLASTRCSAAVASTYAVMKLLGREGYRKIVKECMDTTFYLKKRVEEIGLNLVIPPVINIVGIDVRDAKKTVELLDKKGWKVSRARNPPCLRIVVMPHVTKKVVDEFIPDLESVCRELKEI